MTTAMSTDPEAETYLAAVRAELVDLPDEERGELLEDLALHLAELVTDEGEETLRQRLGDPTTYAADLRAAAGLPPAAGGAASDVPGRRDGGSARLLTAVLERSRTIWHHRWMAEARAFIPQLRPAWWVVRGYLTVALPALWTVNRSDDVPVPSVGGNQIIGGIVVLAAIVLSVRLGSATDRLAPPARRLIAAANIALGLAAAILALQLESRLSYGYPVYRGSAAFNAYELTSRHGPVTNIYPYSRDGQPLEDVLLFDQDGRPLRTAHQEWWPDGCQRVVDTPLATDGVPVDFAYPHRYVPAATVRELGPAGPQAPVSTHCSATLMTPPVPLPQMSAPTTTSMIAPPAEPSTTDPPAVTADPEGATATTSLGR